MLRRYCPNPYDPPTVQACVGNGQMYNALIRPLLNTTVKGFLWYQGENSLGFDAGSSAANTGCKDPAVSNHCCHHHGCQVW